MSKENDKKYTVVAITPKGLLFCGIYSNEADADTAVLENASHGDVLCVAFDRTVKPGVPKSRGVYASAPTMTTFYFKPSKTPN